MPFEMINMISNYAVNDNCSVEMEKLNLQKHAIYLLHTISFEPYKTLEASTWRCLLKGIIEKIKHFQMERTLAHSLSYYLFKSLVLCSISNAETGDILWNEFMLEINILIHYETFVIQWREIIRNLTIELLRLMQEDNKKSEIIPNFSPANYDLLSNTNTFMNGFKFQSFDEAFMIFDRMLHLLGSPLLNKCEEAHAIHLEGFTDSVNIFILAFRARKPFRRYFRPEHMIRSKEPDNIPMLNYGFAHSLISTAIDLSSNKIPKSIEQNLPSRQFMPESDTLAFIYSPWLFDICFFILSECSRCEQQNMMTDFNVSFNSLSHIFLTLCNSACDDEYLVSYYQIIRLSLTKTKISSKIHEIVLRECSNGCIFGKHLAGVNCLIPDFVNIMKVICGYCDELYMFPQTSINEQNINNSLSISMSLICFASHFGKTKIAGTDNMCFQQIKNIICDVFIFVIQNELSVNIANIVINGLVLIIYDEISSTKDINVITTAMDSIVYATNINKINTASITTFAIGSLCAILDMMPLCEIDPQLIINHLMLPFLQNVYKYLDAAKNKKNDPKFCKICTDKLYCCLEMLFTLPSSIIKNSKIMDTYFKILHQALCLQPNVTQPSNRHGKYKYSLYDIVLAAETSQIMLFNYLGNYPLQHDTGAISSNCQDIDIENKLCMCINENVLISTQDRILTDMHQSGPEKGTRILTRDESGKFAWHFTPSSILPTHISVNLNLNHNPELDEEKDQMNIIDKNDSLSFVSPSEDSLKQVLNYTSQPLTPSKKTSAVFLEKSSLKLEQCLAQQNKEEFEIYKMKRSQQYKQYEDKSSDMKMPETVTEYDCSRILLRDLGILTAENLLGTTAENNQRLLGIFGKSDRRIFSRRLRLMDAFEREKFQIGIIYVGPHQESRTHVLSNRYGSVLYEQFISKIGWKIDLLSHEGFTGGLHWSTTGRYATYYATAIYEMIFHVATNIPCPKMDRTFMNKNRVLADKVWVVWCENGREYIPWGNNFFTVCIIIYPLNNGLYRIKIHNFKTIDHNMNFCGPLLNNMIVREHMLPVLVRITCLNVSRMSKTLMYHTPFNERRLYLKEVVAKHALYNHESLFDAFFPCIDSK
eukprot:364118_1